MAGKKVPTAIIFFVIAEIAMMSGLIHPLKQLVLTAVVIMLSEFPVGNFPTAKNPA